MARRTAPPRVPGYSANAGLLREGYAFISGRCDALGTDVFVTRLAGRRVVCCRGPEAARLLYSDAPLTRRGALPKSVLHLLQDEGSGQLLDGEEHARRKAMFLPLLDRAAVRSFSVTLEQEWQAVLADWDVGSRIRLYDAANQALGRAALAWCGVPTSPAETTRLIRELVEMVDQAGTVGPRNWRARQHRQHAEGWAGERIDGARRRGPTGNETSVLDRIAQHQERGGRLPTEVAAVELLNVLRPLVANARFVVFAALALETHKDAVKAVRSGDPERLLHFAQEVRRFYPFFPMVGAVSTAPVELQGYEFGTGTWLLLDLYGTNHDDRLWPQPYRFRPRRFETTAEHTYTLVPQGAGEHASSHRCPGENLTLAAVTTSIRCLSQVSYHLPVQDLGYTLNRMPALPRSGLLLDRVADHP